MAKIQRIYFILLQSGPRYHRHGTAVEVLTMEAVEEYWKKIPSISPKGLPIHYVLGGRVIGKMLNASLLKRENYVCIECDAVITDEILLTQSPPLNLEQVARASILRDPEIL